MLGRSDASRAVRGERGAALSPEGHSGRVTRSRLAHASARGGWHDPDSPPHGGGAAVRATPASNGSHRDWRERTPSPLWLVRGAVTPGLCGQERALSGQRWRRPRPRGDARAERSRGRSRRSGGGLRAGGTRQPPPPWRRNRRTRCSATASSSGWVARGFCRLWGPTRAARRRQRRGLFPPSIPPSLPPPLPRSPPAEQELRVGRARPRRRRGCLGRAAHSQQMFPRHPRGVDVAVGISRGPKCGSPAVASVWKLLGN